MQPERIADLLAPFLPAAQLSPLQLEQVSNHLDLLTQWNARINLSAIRSPEEIVTRHFGESFFLAQTLFPSGHPLPISADAASFLLYPGAPPSAPHSRLPDPQFLVPNPRPLVPNPQSPLPAPRFSAIDFGSGAGFPGLPLKIWVPALPLTLIESHNKKATFLKEAIRRNTLTDINVFSGRAEDYDATATLVTMRAVERFEDSLPLAANLVTSAGTLALLIGASQVTAACSLVPSVVWKSPITIPLSRSRVLLLSRNTV